MRTTKWEWYIIITLNNRNKNILVLTTSFPLKDLPVGMHVYNNCKFLVKKGINTTVITPHFPREKLYEIKEGIKIVRFPYFIPRKLQRVAYYYGLVHNIKNSILAKLQIFNFIIFFIVNGLKYGKKCDIIHANWFPAGLVGLIIKKIFKKKLVLMMHHTHNANIFYRMILKNTDYLLTNSVYVLKRTLNIYNVKNSKIIPVSIDYNKFKPEVNTKHIRARIQIHEKEIFVFSAGRFINLKGFEYLIKAFQILIYKYKKKYIKLRIAGQGPNRERYEKLINKYNLNNFIKIIGYIPNTKIHNYYNEADIFVIPSIIDENEETEGFGVVSLEANACETPVIASRVGGIVDVIEDGYNGFFVEQKNPNEIADKIIKLAENDKLRKQIGRNGRKRIIEKFNWDKITDEIIEVYNSI